MAKKEKQPEGRGAKRGGVGGLDKTKARRSKAKAKGGVNTVKLDKGHTLIYVCPIVHEDDGTNWAEATIAQGLGPEFKGKCLSPAGLKRSKGFLSLLKKKGKTLEELAVASKRCEELVEATWGEDAAPPGESKKAKKSRQERYKRCQFKNRWCFPVIVMGYRRDSGYDWTEEGGGQVQLLDAGPKIGEALIDKIMETDDCSDPDGANFIVIKKTGAGINTDYAVEWDRDTLTNPAVLDEDTWNNVLRDCVPGGNGDPYWPFVWGAHSVDEIEEMFDASDEDGDDDDDEDEAPRRRRSEVKKKSVREHTRSRPAPVEDEDEDGYDVDDEEAPDEDGDADDDEPDDDDDSDSESGSLGDVEASAGGDVDELDAHLSRKAGARGASSESRRRRGSAPPASEKPFDEKDIPF